MTVSLLPCGGALADATASALSGKMVDRSYFLDLTNSGMVSCFARIKRGETPAESRAHRQLETTSIPEDQF